VGARGAHDVGKFVMPYFDRTGPWGGGSRTGWRRGFCPPSMFGQESVPTLPYADIERAPTADEMQLWQRAEDLKRRVILNGTMARLQHKQLMIAAQFAAANGVTIDDANELPEVEQRMLAALSEIDMLRRYHCDVNGLKLGVRPSTSAHDLDIVAPPNAQLGILWVPIIIGGVILVGIIARWIYVENEVTTVSEKYNHVLEKADSKFCEDPNSTLCQDWKVTKKQGDYHKNETLIDSVKAAVGTVGHGIGTGLALLIPILAVLYLPRGRKNG
jgi:hypothetical protein